jgi:hypothetical protein
MPIVVISRRWLAAGYLVRGLIPFVPRATLSNYHLRFVMLAARFPEQFGYPRRHLYYGFRK